MKPADIFAEQRPALAAVVAEVRNLITRYPEDTHGQIPRLEAWCAATEQFLDLGYWHSAVDIERAGQRAAHADRAARAAAATAAGQATAAAGAKTEAGEAHAHHARRYPAPPLG